MCLHKFEERVSPAQSSHSFEVRVSQAQISHWFEVEDPVVEGTGQFVEQKEILEMEGQDEVKHFPKRRGKGEQVEVWRIRGKPDLWTRIMIDKDQEGGKVPERRTFRETGASFGISSEGLAVEQHLWQHD